MNTSQVRDCEFASVATSSEGGGGALHVEAGGLEVDNSRFTDCSALSGYGGAILIRGGGARRSGKNLWSQLNITSSEFVKCLAGRGGGGVALINDNIVGASVVVAHTNFTDNVVSLSTSNNASGAGMLLAYRSGVASCPVKLDGTFGHTPVRVLFEAIKWS
jgi:hypothetical protein